MHDTPKEEIRKKTFKLLLFISHRSPWSGAIEAGIIDSRINIFIFQVENIHLRVDVAIV
jgi:hypothetical protein